MNNTPGVTGPNIYATVQSAHDAAAIGDIIYLEPSSTNSPNNLGPLVCTKRLTIIGTGYFLAGNASEPGMPADKREAWITTAQFNNGSAGSVVTGVVFINNGLVYVRDVNIKFERCYLNKIYLGAQLSGATLLSASHNTRIARCYFPGDGFSIEGQPWVIGGTTFTPNNCQIENNILLEGIYKINNSIINNNICYNYYSWSGVSTTGCVFKNNVFLGSVEISGNTFFNNISVGNNLPAGNGNTNNANGSLLFISTNRTYDKHYQLGSSSAAIGAGENGTDCGAFGGATPYILSGLPPYPVITDLQVSGTGSTAVPLNVTISAKSNN